MSPDYGLGLRITSTICFLIGGGSNLLVVLLARTTKNDSKSYILLLQFAALANFIHALSGWIATNRHESSGNFMIFVSYGPGGLIGPRLCAFFDSLSTQAVQFNPMMLSCMMTFRCLILYDYRFKKSTIAICIFIMYFLTFPVFYLLQVTYNDISVADNLTEALKQETQQISSYAMSASTVLFSLIPVYNTIPIGTFVICIISSVAMSYRLYVVNDSLSEKTRSIYKGFIMLLLVDTTVMFIYFFLVTQMDLVTKLSKMSDEMKVFCSFFSHPFFAIPRMVQGIALLFLVPYLRQALFTLFKPKRTNVISVASSNNPSSVA